MEQRMIYTLIPVREGARWIAEIGMRTTQVMRTRDSISARRSFEGKDEADRWLLEHAKVLNVTFRPNAIPATSVFLPLGGVIPPLAS
jgi:hypothetical protein